MLNNLGQYSYSPLIMVFFLPVFCIIKININKETQVHKYLCNSRNKFYSYLAFSFSCLLGNFVSTLPTLFQNLNRIRIA